MDVKLNEKGGKETLTETSKREREKEMQHIAALSPVFPPACSQTSSFNLFFSRTLRRHERSWEDYNQASVSMGFHDVNDKAERRFGEL